MRSHQPTTRTGILIMAIVTIMTVLTPAIAAAHEGHAQADGGSGASVIMQAGGAALAVAAIYLLGALVVRHRDRYRGDREG